MPMMSLGVVAESTELPLRQAIVKAAGLGCRAIQFDAVGDSAPDRLGETARRDLRNLLKSHRLELAALNVPLRRGLDNSDDQQPRLEFIQKVMDLAGDLGGSRVLVPMPELAKPEESNEITLRESLQTLSRYGDRTGRTLAIEVGLDPISDVSAYLDHIGVGSVTFAFDPMNFMIRGHDPLSQLQNSLNRLGMIHARDGRSSRVSGSATEMPVGAGDMDWIVMFATLGAAEFRGPVCLRRLSGTQRLTDIAAGVQFLRRFFPAAEMA